jgi:D-inositol-3-phosphate glycosyltransferase
VTVYAQKRQLDMPDRAGLGGGLRVVHIPVGAVGKRGDAELLARVPAFSDQLRARWRRERPDVVHAVSWTSGLAALMATRDLGIPVVQAFSSPGVAERRDHASADPARPPPARPRLELAMGRLVPSSREQSPRRPGSSPARARSPRTSATPDPKARHVPAPAPVPSS